MLGALGYLLISGAAFATVRSYIMISIMFLAVLLDRPALALRNVALAALLILRGVAGKPARCRLPDVVCGGGGAGVGLRMAARCATRRAGRRSARGVLGKALLFFGRHRHLDAGGGLRGRAVRHLSFPQHAAVRDPRQPAGDPGLQSHRHAGGLAALVAMPFGLEAAPLRLMGLGIEAMVWCANAVARLPGAVGRVPAIPTYAFVLMVAGGLWWALWSTRWRVLGVVPIALGLMLAPTGQRPDVLIGRGAELVAVRGADGRLSALAGRGSTFELARWLEHDGDGRPAAEAGKAQAFLCDSLGCTAQVKGRAHCRRPVGGGIARRLRGGIASWSCSLPSRRAAGRRGR